MIPSHYSSVRESCGLCQTLHWWQCPSRGTELPPLHPQTPSCPLCHCQTLPRTSRPREKLPTRSLEKVSVRDDQVQKSWLYKSFLFCSTWTSLLTHLHQDKTVPNSSQHQQSASFTCIIHSPFARSRSLPHYCLGLVLFWFFFFMSTLYIPPFLQIFLPGFLAHSLDILLTEKWIED